MKIDVILRGASRRQRARLAAACEARLARSLSRYASRLHSVELRLTVGQGAAATSRASLAVQPERGHAYLVSSDADRPWAATAAVAQAARRRLDEQRKRNRARTRRAQREFDARRWAA